MRPDIVTMSLADLNTEYLEVPETVALKDFAERERHLNWWSSKYGATKVLEFGVLQARAARDALIPGRANATVDRYLAPSVPHGTSVELRTSCQMIERGHLS